MAAVLVEEKEKEKEKEEEVLFLPKDCQDPFYIFDENSHCPSGRTIFNNKINLMKNIK